MEVPQENKKFLECFPFIIQMKVFREQRVVFKQVMLSVCLQDTR